MAEPKIVCPLGSQCEEIKDNVFYRCAWYTKLEGKDPQSEKTIDEWRCAIPWMPLMMVEIAQTNRGISGTVGSLRNEVVKRQDVMNTTLSIAATSKRKELPAITVQPYE